MFDVSVVILDKTGPHRLTDEEAALLATRFFFEHDHLAKRPSPCVYWVRKDEFGV